MAKLQQLKDWFQHASEHPAWQDWVRNSTESRSFYDGDQLSAEDITDLKDRGQPVIQINKIFAKINNLKGAQRLVRSRIGAQPRTRQDVDVARNISDVLRYIDYRSDYGQEESLAFDDGIIEGIGWLEAYIKEDEAGRKEIDIDHELASRMRFDPLSTRYDLSDARFVSRDKWVDLDEAKELFRAKAAQLEALVNVPGDADTASSVVSHGPQDDYDLQNPNVRTAYLDSKRKQVRLVEMWYRTYQDVYWKGSEYIADISEYTNKFEAENVSLAKAGISKTRQRVVRMAIFCADLLILDTITPHNHKLNINKFPFFPFFCFRKKSGEPYGYVLQMLDAQREINKRRSKALHILNTAQVIADVNAVEDIEDLREEAARPDGILLKKQGTELTIERNINLASSQLQIMVQSSNDLQDISGIFDESTGKATNARSGTAINQRKQASNQNNLIVLDNLRRMRLLLGRFELGLIKQHYSEEQILLITDESSGEPKDVSLKGVAQSLVDVVIDEFQPDPSAQHEEYVQLVEAAKSGIGIPPEVVIKASNLKDKKEILEFMKQMQNQQNPTTPGEQAPQGLPATAVEGE